MQNTQYWPSLPGAATSLAMASHIKESQNLHTIIVQDALQAWKIETELRFFLGDDTDINILQFPEWETLPYDIFSPYQDIVSERLKALQQIQQLKHGILIVTINAAMNRLPPVTFLKTHSFYLQIGSCIQLESLRNDLVNNGYRQVAQVYEHGEYAIRGSIFDIFPMGSEAPFRIELFDEEIDTIRTFDIETQRSLEKLDKIELLPAHEFPLTKDAISVFRTNFREQFSVNPTECAIYQDISQALPSPGAEYYIPLFFSETASLLDYLPSNTHVFYWKNTHDKSQQFWKEIQQRHEQLSHDITRPILAPSKAFFSTSEIFAKLNQFSQTEILPNLPLEKEIEEDFLLPNISIDAKSNQPLKALQNYLDSNNFRVLFCAETNGRREVLLGLLANIKIHPTIVNSWEEFLKTQERFCLIVYPMSDSLVDPAKQIILITENQLFGERVVQQRRRKAQQSESYEQIIRSLAELKIGDPVVHIEHGVGRYLGLQTLTISNLTAEYLILEYAGQAKLYLPVSSLHLISRYTGTSENAPLHKLGSDQWEKAKKKAADKVYDVAAELLDVYARRAIHQGHQFNLDIEYQKFANDFPFEETPDQAKAIEQVIQDMSSNKTMDRLVCGDVGFGKTEVAMRAAFIAVSNGKQVAILAPTTLLAQQHFQTFSDRFANWPVRIDVLSRFKTPKEQAQIMEQVKAGKIDIIIGTHKLFNETLDFSHLGLLIIDEEHRFGVKQKEKLKSLRTNIDILSLTATPIPRTLNMAFSGIRDLSIIATPPAKRLAVKTFVMQKKSHIIREAILREILRGGQVYYLHNDINTIEQTAHEIKELVSEAQVIIGHGQMHERELEKVMSNFYHRRFNVLVCTTIIETGIDIPSANTIIIERADKFGLAQLHQLRGRVGRSHHQAYAYLLIPHKNALTKDAEKRLEAISQHEELGAGFILATYDLEIRGAGELLGEEQSGQIQEIGFSLYMEMLERAVNSMKSGKKIDLTKPLQTGTEIDLKINTYIPEDYIADVHTRLILYKRIANAENESSLSDLQVEIIDRFGPLPEAVKNLFFVTQIKLIAEPLGIKKIEATFSGGRIHFTTPPNIDPIKIIQLVQTRPKEFQLDGADKIKFKFISTFTKEELPNQIKQLLIENFK